MSTTAADHRRLGPNRWRGQPGRLEVWYLTATDPVSGTGLWLHHETVAPADGGPAHGLGWIALFPVDGPPVWRRFGPDPVPPPGPATSGDAWFQAGPVSVTADRLIGSTIGATWDLACTAGGEAVWTFPRPVWMRELLPAAQVLAAPALLLTGRIEVDGHVLDLDGVPAGSARIYGHGNAARWGWLHADLGGGDVLELVSAVSLRPGLRKLPPFTFAQLRIDGRDRFRIPAVPGRVQLGLPTWQVQGLNATGRSRLRVDVLLPPESSVAVDYADPDGAPAVCTNSERADAEIVLERWNGRWTLERSWTLIGTAHAEVGLRT